MGERKYGDWVIYRRVLSEARGYWLHIGAFFVLNLLSTPIALLTPLPMKIAVDSVLGGGPLPDMLGRIVPGWITASTGRLLIFTVALIITIEVLSQFLSLSKTFLKTTVSEGLTMRVRAMLFRHAQRLSLTYHDRRGTADANYRIQRDATAIPTVAVEGVIPFVASTVTLASMILVTARIQPTLALIAVTIAPVLVALTFFYRRQLRARHREVKALESSALAVVQEVLSSLRVVKAFGQEDVEEQRFMARAGEGMRARLRVRLVDASFWVALSIVTALGTGAVLYTGIRSVQAGTLTLGSLLLVMAYLSRIYGPLSSMSQQVASLQSGFASAERAFTLLDEERDVPERPHARPLVRASGTVEFRDVSFGYEGGKPVLQDLSFSVQPGTRVGIGGRTGAGKTTLVSLLTRFYDPTAGAILLDGVDLRDYRLADLRNQFAIVLQDPVLFSTTIRENIAYGRVGASLEEIISAAQAADIHDFISALPEGYETAVGERGMTLSGGERQRISLARAILKDAPILILDEPTSSVDIKTEAAIVQAMERLMKGRTTFMIAHRLSTLDACDRRVWLRDGQLLEADHALEDMARGVS